MPGTSAGGPSATVPVPALLAQLEVTYADGSVQRVVTDGSWKVAGSEILASDLLMGETLDARLAVKG